MGVVGLVGLVLVASLRPTSSTVRVDVRPRLALWPVDWTLTVRIEPQADHRALVVAWWRDANRDYPEGSFGVSLDGADARRLHQRTIRRVPVGEYAIVAEIQNGLGEVVAVDTATAFVLPWGEQLKKVLDAMGG